MPTRPAVHRVGSPRVGSPQVRRHGRDDRPSSCARGYDRTWQRLRSAHLAEHPLCVECERQGRLAGATQVDHVRPHRGDDGLRLDPGNLQSLCDSCHSRKTATEDGGFGRQPKR